MSDVIPVIPVGPGDFEKARAARVLDSLVRHEPALPRVVLLIDGVTEADLRQLLRPGPLELTFVKNPRNGRGSGIYDGLACGLTAAFKFIADHHPGAHGWKIDSDGLVLRPTSGQIDAFFAAYPKHGLAGTYETNPGRKSREAEFVPGGKWPDGFSARSGTGDRTAASRRHSSAGTGGSPGGCAKPMPPVCRGAGTCRAAATASAGATSRRSTPPAGWTIRRSGSARR